MKKEGEEKGGKKCSCVIVTAKRSTTTKTDTKEKIKNEIAEDFINGFSQRLLDFYNAYCNWWVIDKMVNNSFPNFSKKDITFCCCMQILVENRVKQLAKKLPDDGKKLIKTLKKKMGVKQ